MPGPPPKVKPGPAAPILLGITLALLIFGFFGTWFYQKSEASSDGQDATAEMNWKISEAEAEAGDQTETTDYDDDRFKDDKVVDAFGVAFFILAGGAIATGAALALYAIPLASGGASKDYAGGAKLAAFAGVAAAAGVALYVMFAVPAAFRDEAKETAEALGAQDDDGPCAGEPKFFWGSCELDAGAAPEANGVRIQTEMFAGKVSWGAGAAWYTAAIGVILAFVAAKMDWKPSRSPQSYGAYPYGPSPYAAPPPYAPPPPPPPSYPPPAYAPQQVAYPPPPAPPTTPTWSQESPPGQASPPATEAACPKCASILTLPGTFRPVWVNCPRCGWGGQFH